MSKHILELPAVSTIEQLQSLLNDRIRDVNRAFDGFVDAPADADIDAAFHRVVQVADPQNDLDAVNLRTLKRKPSDTAEPEAQHKKAGTLDAYTIVFSKDGTVVDGEETAAYTMLSDRTGSLIEVSFTAEGAPTTGDAEINGTYMIPKKNPDDPEPIAKPILKENLVLLKDKIGPVYSDKFVLTIPDFFPRGTKFKPVLVAMNGATFVTIEFEIKRKAHA